MSLITEIESKKNNNQVLYGSSQAFTYIEGKKKKRWWSAILEATKDTKATRSDLDGNSQEQAFNTKKWNVAPQTKTSNVIPRINKHSKHQKSHLLHTPFTLVRCCSYDCPWSSVWNIHLWLPEVIDRAALIHLFLKMWNPLIQKPAVEFLQQ